MNARCTHLTCTPKITADTHTHTPPYRLLTPSIPVEAPRDQRRGRGVASGPSRCDDPALTECQYKAIYKRMKNRPSITGNFSAPLPQEAWPASRKVREGGEKTKRRKRRRGGDHGPMDVITVHCARKLGGGDSNRTGKGIGAGDRNSDVRSREITVMNVTVGLHL